MSISSVRTIKLSKKYNDKTVLYDLSINLPSNGIFGILGKNGAGKTTLLAMLMGLITPTSGEIFIFATPIAIPIRIQWSHRLET